METRPVDPRDQDTEVYDPVYRVYFWKRQSSHPESGFRSDEYEITGAADVHEVLAWANAHAEPGQTYTAYVFHRGCSIRLAGEDPSRG
jgi:hypothetical protein